MKSLRQCLCIYNRERIVGQGHGHTGTRRHEQCLGLRFINKNEVFYYKRIYLFKPIIIVSNARKVEAVYCCLKHFVY